MPHILEPAQALWYVAIPPIEESLQLMIFFFAYPGPVVRITPTLLLCSDATKLPDIYHRKADKSNFYVMGSFGKTESVFNIQKWQQHAAARKLIASSVSKYT